MAATAVASPTPTPTPPLEPTAVEQSHIQQALDASQSAMDAIGTITDIATYTLTILGVFIAILALWGVGMIVKTSRDSAKQIANKRMDDYIASDQFNALMKARVDKAVKAERLDAISRKLDELTRDEDDEEPFQEKGTGK